MGPRALPDLVKRLLRFENIVLHPAPTAG